MPLSAITNDDFRPRPAKEAARHFGRKTALTSELFERLSDEAKQRAFRIAGLHNVNSVQRAREIVRRAIRDGTPLRDVRIELLKLFDDEDAPSFARLRTMFRMNTHQAYNDARRAVLDAPEAARVFPFRQYLTVGNGKPGFRGVRATHAVLHRRVFAWDDPFWDAHTPPWGWGCRCFVRPLTLGQVKRLGVVVRTLEYVRKRIRVPGQRRRGIEADPRFARGGLDLRKIDEELREVAREMMA